MTDDSLPDAGDSFALPCCHAYLIEAKLAGTKLPIWAITTISATCVQRLCTIGRCTRTSVTSAARKGILNTLQYKCTTSNEYLTCRRYVLLPAPAQSCRMVRSQVVRWNEREVMIVGVSICKTAPTPGTSCIASPDMLGPVTMWKLEQSARYVSLACGERSAVSQELPACSSGLGCSYR